jgi:hypothetical protein
MPKKQKRQLVPGKVIYADDLTASPIENQIDLQNAIKQLKENPVFQEFENELVSGMIRDYETAFEKIQEALNNQFPDLSAIFEPVLLNYYRGELRNSAHGEINRRILNAQRRFNEYVELPYVKKAQLPLTMQLSWLFENRIYNAAGRYFPFIDFLFDQAPKYINRREKEYIDRAHKGAYYHPKDSKFAYTMATVKTTPQFWTEALRTLPKTNGKVPQVRHGQKIVQRFIDCNLFDRIKVGPRDWAIIVGYYMQANSEKYYKKPLGTKRNCNVKLRKFKVF